MLNNKATLCTYISYLSILRIIDSRCNVQNKIDNKLYKLYIKYFIILTVNPLTTEYSDMKRANSEVFYL